LWLSFVCGWVFLMLPPMPGAPVAMAFLTVSPITLVFVSLVENEHSGTTLSEMWSMLGLRKLA
jgi:hypothetical protein